MKPMLWSAIRAALNALTGVKVREVKTIDEEGNRVESVMFVYTKHGKYALRLTRLAD